MHECGSIDGKEATDPADNFDLTSDTTFYHRWITNESWRREKMYVHGVAIDNQCGNVIDSRQKSAIDSRQASASVVASVLSPAAVPYIGVTRRKKMIPFNTIMDECSELV
jgi:hypothetical protein